MHSSGEISSMVAFAVSSIVLRMRVIPLPPIAHLRVRDPTQRLEMPISAGN